MAVPLINGKAYDYTQITISVLGSPLAGVSQINYTETQDKTNNFGTGNRPVSRGQGAINATCSLEISMTDVERLRSAAPNRSLLFLPAFDIIVIYINGVTTHRHIIKNVEFSDDGTETSQGDTDIKRTFNLTPSHIEFLS
jgi:hypothetical protein